MTRLGREEFERALRWGHGRALRDVREHGIGDRFDLLIAASTKCVAYDPQCEHEGRGAWLLEIADAGGVAKQLVEPVIAALRSSTEHARFYDVDQLCDLALGLALRGHAIAETALGSFVDSLTDVEPDAAGRAQMRRLRGEPSPPDDSDADGPADHARRERVLDERWVGRSFDEIAARLSPARREDRDLFRGLPRWGKHASAEDLERAFALLVGAANDLQRRWIAAFRRRPLPRWHPALLDCLVSDRWLVCSSAYSAIEASSDPGTRAAGLERLARNGLDREAGALLASNAQSGDEIALRDALPGASAGDEALHDAVFALREMGTRSPCALEWRELLVWCFEHSPCGMCRDVILSRLVPLGASEELLADARSDANADARRLVGASGPTL